MSERKTPYLQEAAQKIFIPKIVMAAGTPPAQSKVILVNHPRGPELYLDLSRGEANILQRIYDAPNICSYGQLLENSTIRMTSLVVNIFRINQKLAPFNIKIETVRLNGYALHAQSKKILMRIITDDLYDALEAEAPPITGKLKNHSIINKHIMYAGNTVRHTVVLEDAEAILEDQRAHNSLENKTSETIRVLPSQNSIRTSRDKYYAFLKGRHTGLNLV